jgi:hypothetical protein
MLRYTLQTKPDEKVRLEEEIVYLENFIPNYAIVIA